MFDRYWDHDFGPLKGSPLLSMMTIQGVWLQDGAARAVPRDVGEGDRWGGRADKEGGGDLPLQSAQK